jgi:hypothetical protein
MDTDLGRVMNRKSSECFPRALLRRLIAEIASIEGIGNPEGFQIFKTENRQIFSEQGVKRCILKFSTQFRSPWPARRQGVDPHGIFTAGKHRESM